MPITETNDPPDLIIEIKTSAIYEMLLSLQALLAHPEFIELRDKAEAALGEEFLREAAALSEVMRAPVPYAELATDFEDRDDVDGFIEYISTMPEQLLTFYLLGRYFPLEELPESPTAVKIGRLIDQKADSGALFDVGPVVLHDVYPNLDRFDNVRRLGDELCELWRRYWNGFFKEQAASLREEMEQSVQDNRRVLEQRGGTGLLRHILGHTNLAPTQPPDVPLTRVEFFPVVHTFKGVLGIGGYGTFQFMYDCRVSVDHTLTMEAYKSRSIELLKALGDENRLKIVKLIAQFRYHRMFGNHIARIMRLSQSVVSRHLTQLKRAGIIKEHTTDNRSFTYSVEIDRLRALCSELELYITDERGPRAI